MDEQDVMTEAPATAAQAVVAPMPAPTAEHTAQTTAGAIDGEEELDTIL